jgi:putative ABC transport system substrate-binding protein
MVPLIGFLNSASPSPFLRLVNAFLQGLNDGGYVEGRNVAIEYRWAEGQFARLPGDNHGPVIVLDAFGILRIKPSGADRARAPFASVSLTSLQ